LASEVAVVAAVLPQQPRGQASFLRSEARVISQELRYEPPVRKMRVLVQETERSLNSKPGLQRPGERSSTLQTSGVNRDEHARTVLCVCAWRSPMRPVQRTRWRLAATLLH